MLLLGLDTATPAVTVALFGDDGALAEHTAPDDRRHGELLAPAIDSVLRAAGVTTSDLTGVAVGVGPGPFTGLRVGLMTARMMGSALAVPVHGVCTLDALALEAVDRGTGVDEPFRVATDARRKEVYWAAYVSRPSASAGGGASARVTRTDGPHVARPAEVAWDGPVAGQGPQLYPGSFPDGRDPRRPSAAVLCRWVAEGYPTLEPLPLYLRRPDAAEPPAARSRG